MSDDDVTHADYDQMWSELRQLIDAWHDRHSISSRGTAGLLLQYGVTFARHAREITLDQILDLVRAQWTLLEKKVGTR